MPFPLASHHAYSQRSAIRSYLYRGRAPCLSLAPASAHSRPVVGGGGGGAAAAAGGGALSGNGGGGGGSGKGGGGKKKVGSFVASLASPGGGLGGESNAEMQQRTSFDERLEARLQNLLTGTMAPTCCIMRGSRSSRGLRAALVDPDSAAQRVRGLSTRSSPHREGVLQSARPAWMNREGSKALFLPPRCSSVRLLVAATARS